MRVCLVVVDGAVQQAVGAQLLEAGHLVVEPPRRARRHRTRGSGGTPSAAGCRCSGRKPNNSSWATGNRFMPGEPRKVATEGVGGRIVYRLRRPHLLHQAMLHHHDAVAEAHRLDLVVGHQLMVAMPSSRWKNFSSTRA